MLLYSQFLRPENLPEFGGDEKLQRQYEECELISTGLTTVSKAIQSNQIYDRVLPDGADIEKKYVSFSTIHFNLEISMVIFCSCFETACIYIL